MITDIFLFLVGLSTGFIFHWIRNRSEMLDMQAEVAHANSMIEALRADNADLVTIIESHKSPWG